MPSQPIPTSPNRDTADQALLAAVTRLRNDPGHGGRVLATIGPPADRSEHRRPGLLAPDFDPDSDDQELLAQVVGHFHDHLMASADRAAILGRLGVPVELAARLRIGISDRTLGNRIPGRRRKAGQVLRSRLSALGIYRPSGHETFVSCVVVPVVDPGGSIVGIYGTRPGRRGDDEWATGLPGAIFNHHPEHSHPEGSSTLVVGSIPDALAVITAGHQTVVAPGRPGGFNKVDLKTLTATHRELIIVGRATDDLAAKLAALGATIQRAATDLDVAVTLGSTPSPPQALQALLVQREAVNNC